LKILFLHGLEGSPDGTKAQYLKKEYDAYTPILDTSELIALKNAEPTGEWTSINRGIIIAASRVPLQQAREALVEYDPDVIIGSSMGGALLAKLVKEHMWMGPCIFLASAAKLMFGIGSVTCRYGVPLKWVHGYDDDVIPVTHSMNAAQESHGTCHLVHDDHRLESLVESGMLKELVEDAISEMV
jgi:hypothetical protein